MGDLGLAAGGQGGGQDGGQGTDDDGAAPHGRTSLSEMFGAGESIPSAPFAVEHRSTAWSAPVRAGRDLPAQQPPCARGGGCRGEGDPPPGVLAPGIARGAVVPRGGMPGRQGRMSSTPPPRSSPRCSHSSLTACPGPRLAGHGRWRGWGRAFGACCFAGKLRSPAGSALVALSRGLDPYVIPYVNPYVNPYVIPCAADGVPLASRVVAFVQVIPPRGGGAAAPSGALRAID
jgi:hypothetical protein